MHARYASGALGPQGGNRRFQQPSVGLPLALALGLVVQMA